MTPANVFQLCNLLAMLGWLLLIAFPLWKFADKIIVGIIVGLFSVIYTYYLASNLSGFDMKSFGSLKGVTALFTNPLAVLVGWVHYLAFDLMVGTWIKKNALLHGIRHWLVIPCLLLCFMFGPVGLLLYLLIRFAKTKNYFSANYN